MKIVNSLLFCSITLFTACNKETIKGGGAVISENRTVPAFTEIQLNGDADASVVAGPVQQVTVNGYENLLPVYETKIIGTTLHLGFKPNYYNVRNNNIKVTIVVPDLTFIRTNGSGNFIAKNFMNGNNFSAYINGSGNIDVKDSKFQKVTYNVNGSGNIHANTTEAIEAQAEIHGSGNILLRVTGKLTANIAGSGNIDYWGNPATTSTQVNGSGRISKK